MGCSCQPSPALTTLTRSSSQPAICHGTPAEACRTTMASTPMASMVRTVSRSDSPFFTDEEPTLKVIVSAESRLAACSKLSRVRVESS